MISSKKIIKKWNKKMIIKTLISGKMRLTIWSRKKKKEIWNLNVLLKWKKHQKSTSRIPISKSQTFNSNFCTRETILLLYLRIKQINLFKNLINREKKLKRFRITMLFLTNSKFQGRGTSLKNKIWVRAKSRKFSRILTVKLFKK